MEVRDGRGRARIALGAPPAVGPRRGLLDRRQGRRPHHLRHHRLPDDRAQRQDRPAGPDLRRQGRRRPEGRRGHRQGQADRPREGRDRPPRRAARGQRHGHRPVVDVRGPRLRLRDQRQGPGSRLRRQDRQADLALQHDSLPRREGQRDLGERLLGVDRQRRRVDAHDRRPRGRPRLPAGGDADHRRVRRQPSRRQPVRREPGRRRHQDRQVQVALPDRPPPDLGPRPPGARPADRQGDRRQAAQADCPADQAGVALHLRPHHRRADLADHREAGAADDDEG